MPRLSFLQDFDDSMFGSAHGLNLSLERRWPFFAAYLFHIFASKVTAGSSASGTASAKSSEAASSAIVSAAVATAASTASHQAAQYEEDEAGIAGLDQEDEYQQDDSAAYDELA